MKTLVVLHGWGQSVSNWQYFKQGISHQIPVVLIELPGFGGVPIISEEWGVPEYAMWVKKKLTEISGDKILLGHSFGGRIASLIASENPSWLAGLILYGAPCIYRPSIHIRLKIFLFKLFKRLKIKNSFLEKNEGLLNADQQSLGKVFRKVVPFDQTKELKQIQIPTSLIWGENDTSVPRRIAQEINSLISGSKLILLERVGHNAHQEDPFSFIHKIKELI